MAESAPAADTTPTSNGVTEKHQKPKPEKPDEEKYKTELAKAEKEHAIAMERMNEIKAKLDLARPNNKDSPTAKKQQELRAELSSIRQKQSGFKTNRGGIQEKISALDAQLKSRIGEQKVARSRVSFKSVDEIDQQIERLDKQVEAGTMKLVDEKKALAEISSLRKQRKGFAGFEEAQKGIDDVKAQITELKKTLDNPEAKALSEKYEATAKELDAIKAEQDEAYKSLGSLRDERTKLHAEQQEKFTVIREIKDQYFRARKAHREHEQELYKQRQERKQVEHNAYQKEKRRKIADEKLEEASQPAYMDEILTTEGLIRYFDPSTPEASKTLREPSGFAKEAERKVNDSTIKGTKLSKKEDREEEYFMGTGGKKGKKGRKAAGSPAPSTPTETKFNLSIGVIQELAKINVEPPMNQSNVPTVLEKLKEKLEHWKKDQDKKTKENIEKAQKEIDRLDAEAETQNSQPSPSASNRRTHEIAKKPAKANQSVNGDVSAEAEHAQEKDAEADATEDLEKASIEDKVDDA